MSFSILGWVLERPHLLRVLARGLWRLACFGLVAGAIAAAVNTILRVVSGMGGGAQATYEQLLPGLPTWWIPQSPLGVLFYFTALFAAYLLNELFLQLRRMRRT